ncbi:hypothetical protein NE237_013587 [Protea cynaroides]|uniref:Major facilitator superfamily (MFS) profile domain-containing protein n=1 Tax=Protea cynaroides TaxID=273540 RepID=A0A9Q0H076_9MAGN|nr:hypothetical protein NE237_013587 [Protea cynaroides]
MRLASIFFLAGALIDAFALNVEMLIIGRILLGVGVGFANQRNNQVTWTWLLAGGSSVPIRNRSGEDPRVAECSVPTIHDDRDPGTKLGELCRGGHPPSWMEDSSGIATVLAIMLCVGSLIITETPTSLVEHEKFEEGRATLKRIRDSANVDAEFDLIVHACELARQVKSPYRKLLKRSSHP